MKLIDVKRNKTTGRTRYTFEEEGGYFSYLDTNDRGQWLGGTYKKDSEPHKAQAELIRHFWN